MKTRYLLLSYFATLLAQMAAFYLLRVDGLIVAVMMLVNLIAGLILAFIAAGRLRGRYRSTRLISSHIESREALVLGTMTQRDTRPWQVAELAYMTGLSSAQVNQTLLIAKRSGTLQGKVRRGYMAHPVTGLEVEVWGLTPQTLRTYGGVSEKSFPDDRVESQPQSAAPPAPAPQGRRKVGRRG